jgi:hypothetical protein
MSILWFFFGNSIMLKEANRCMREGLSHMQELKSSHWTPAQRTDLQYVLEKYVSHYFLMNCILMGSVFPH